MKRLDDALKEGHRVYAVIRGSGCASGGGIDTALNSDAYLQSLARCFQDAHVPLESIHMVEAHGSGVAVEDKLEAASLNTFFKDRLQHCAIGSAKPIIGHTGAASGLASVVKSALSLYHEVVPPLTNFSTPLKMHGIPICFICPKTPHHWLRNRGEGPRRACVGAMTSDGNCTHLVLESYESCFRKRKNIH